MSVNSIAKTLGFQRHNGIAYGKYDGIFANITSFSFTGSILFTVHEVKQDTVNEIFSYIDQNKKAFLIQGTPRYENPFLIIDMNSYFAPCTARRIAQTFKQICRFLHSRGIVSCCTACGKKDASYVMGGQTVYLYCEDCCQKEGQKAEAIIAERGHGSYLTGSLGAVAGGFAGLIPWILFGLLRFFSSVSGFIMAFLIVAGYTKFKGKVKKPMIAIVLFLLVVFTFLGVVAADMVYWMQEGYTDFGEILTEIFSDLTLSGISADIIIGLFIAGIGAFAALRSVLIKASGRDVKMKKHTNVK